MDAKYFQNTYVEIFTNILQISEDLALKEYLFMIFDK